MRFLRALSLALLFTLSGALLAPQAAPRVAEAVVNVSVWPALGTTVTLQDGITTITSAGAVVTYTTEIRSLLSQGQLLTHDPQPGSTSIVDYPTLSIDAGAPISVAGLATRAGTYQGQVTAAQYYDTGITTGGGLFRWDGASTTTSNGGTVLGNAGVGRWHRVFSGPIDATWFGLQSTTLTDQSSQISAAVNAANAAGLPVYFPPGTYRCDSTIRILPNAFNGAYGTGFRIVGAGQETTIFDDRVANAPLFDLDSQNGRVGAGSFLAIMGVELSNFTIRRTATAANSVGIRIRSAFNVEIRNVHIDNMTADGLVVECDVGDNDGNNQVWLQNVRIENCDGWGINAAAATTHNENSFLMLDHVFLQGNGTSSGSTPPPSGGMVWKGQILKISEGAFAVNNNVALYVKGDSGLGLNVDIQDTTFENNTGRYVYVTGVNQMRGHNLRINGSNTLFVASKGFEFDGSTYTIRGVDIDHVIVRSGNQNSGFVAFSATGSNMEMDKARIKNASFDLFNDATMTRYSSNWLFGPFPFQARLVAVNSTIMRLEPSVNAWGLGASVPFMISNGASTSGEVIGKVFSVASIAAQPSDTTLEGVVASTLTSQRLYMYVWDNAGSAKLSHSTVAPTVDSTLGYYVKNGDRAKTYVGAVLMDGSGNYDLTQSGWMDPMQVPGTRVGTPALAWVDASNYLHIKTSAPANDNDGVIVGGVVNGKALQGTVTYDPPSLVDGDGVTTSSGAGNGDVTVTGAALGDTVVPAFSLDLQGITLTCWVQATDTVRCRFQNETGGTLNLSSGTLRARVVKQ